MAKVKGKMARLINQGADLDAEIKEREEKIKGIKETLKSELGDGTWTSARGSSVKISTDKKYKDADPKEVYNRMVSMGLEEEFWNTIKVQAKELEPYFNEDERKNLRPELPKGGAVKVSFSV